MKPLHLLTRTALLALADVAHAQGNAFTLNGTNGIHSFAADGSGAVPTTLTALPPAEPCNFIGGAIAAEIAGFPTLHVTNAAPGFATIWWTPPAPGFTLQSTDSLSPTNWVTASSGANNSTTIPAPLPARFYRLFKS